MTYGTGGLVVSTKNSTSVALGANHEWIGESEDIRAFASIDINVAGAPMNAPGTLYLEYSPDQVHWDVSVPRPLTGPFIPPIFLRNVLPFFRARYVNGATPQTELRVTSVLHRGVAERLTRFIDQSIDTNDPLERVQSVVMVANDDGTFSIQKEVATETTVGNRFAGGKITSASVVSSSGDNTIHTPASGKTIVLFWVGLSSSQNNAAEVLVTVKLGSKVCYEWYLGNPGAFSHWEPIVADNANDALTVNLSLGGNNVAVDYTYLEI